MSEMRALTVQQPWLEAIVHGTKRVENRSWAPPGWLPRTRIALHAGKRFDWDAAFPSAERACWAAPEDVPLGAVAAVATIADFHFCGNVPDAACTRAHPCSPWAVPGAYHWVLASVCPLAEPVRCRGALGLWPLPEEVEKAVREQLGASRA